MPADEQCGYQWALLTFKKNIMSDIKALAYEAKRLFDNDNNSEALNYYEELIKLDPNNSEYYYQKGVCLARLRRNYEYLCFHDFLYREFPQMRVMARSRMLNTCNMVVGAYDADTHKFIDNFLNLHPEHRALYLEMKQLCQKTIEENERNERRARRGCYIATACYGSYDCTQVLTFRNFRDEYLSQTFAGRIFIKTYYALSPSFAKWLENRHRINTFIRERFLEPIYKSLKDKY